MKRVCSTAVADAIAEATQNAYSADAYQPKAWRQCCRMLASRGYSAHWIEEIMRSKFTRWASDGRSASKPYGYSTSKDLARFLDSGNGITITPENIQEHLR